MAGGGDLDLDGDPAGIATTAEALDVKRQQSMRKREFGLYASRVRQEPTKQLLASDPSAPVHVPGYPQQHFQQQHSTLLEAQEEQEEEEDYENRLHDEDDDFSRASASANAHADAHAYAYSSDYNQTNAPSSYTHHHIQSHHQTSNHYDDHNYYNNYRSDDTYNYDFDDDFVASPEVGGLYSSPPPAAAVGYSSNNNYVDSNSSMGAGLAPQLPPLPISPISPRWDSLVHSATVIYDKNSALSAAANNDLISHSTRESFDEEPVASAAVSSFASKLQQHAHQQHPFIPEDHPLTLDLDAARPERRHELPSPITTPTSVSSRMFRPDSRQAGEPDSFNFSRPRKPSVKNSNYNYHHHHHHQPASAPPSRPPTANTSSSHEPAHVEVTSPQQASHPASASASASASAWSRSRGVSISSAQSSSTIGSVSLPHMHSYEHLRSKRNPSSSTTATTNTTVGTSPTPAPQSQPSIKLTRHHDQQQLPWMNEEELRSSYRSQFTSSTTPGSLFTSSAHERSSVLTKSSSVTSASLNAYYWGPNGTGAHDENLSADDVLGMYEKGFADDSAMEDNDKHSVHGDDTQEIDMRDDTTNLDAFRPATTMSNSGVRDRLLEAMSEPLPIPSNTLAIPGADAHVVRDSGAFFRNSGLPSSVPNDVGMSLAEEAFKAEKKRREQAGGRTRWNHSVDDEEFALKHDSAKMLDQQTDDFLLILEPELPRRNSARINTPSPSPSQPQLDVRDPAVKDDRSSGPSLASLIQGAHEEDDPDSRDRYGFKKQNQYITREQYDDWNTGYSDYLARRRKKWVQYLKESGLMTDDPGRFPPPSAKTKRFIRKGIPPEWRGAAWFYYAGGPAILAKHSGVYDELVRRADRGEVKTIAKDDIERDLYRTFPDNVRFRRPPPTGVNGKATPETPLHSRNPSTQSANPTPRLPGTEPEVIASLRRVLSAFAIYNPRIGYCQSLNFLAGLLLLFVETEEQAFWLLNIITRVYLPGTHEMSLEGSKVDLGVLMSELRTCLPSVWAKISDDGSGGRKARRKDKGAPIGDDSLPPVTLALTAWFMSCFIGTLPIESTLRVWDVFFYEGSRTLFRIALAVFKLGEPEIKAMSDPMEMFGVVQSIPRRLLDANLLMETCFKRRSGFGHLTADVVEEKRLERRVLARSERERLLQAAGTADLKVEVAGVAGDLASGESGFGDTVRRKGTLFGRKKQLERPRLAEI